MKRSASLPGDYFFGFAIFEGLDNKLSFCEFGASGERCRVFSVKENLLHHGGFASHPITFGRRKRKNRKTHKVIALTALEAPKPPPPRISTVCQFTLSAYWQLAIRMTVSPSALSLPLKFPFAGTRGNVPFCAVYRSKVKAAISPSESY